MPDVLRKWLPLVLIVPGMILLDQVSKTWVQANLELYESIELLPPVLYITRSYNTGVAFGIGSGSGGFVLVLSLVITLVLLYFYIRSEAQAHWQHIGLSLIVGGAGGNIIDRFLHGLVIDFVHFVIPDLISNVSNFADHAIVIGVAVLIINDIRLNWRKPADATTDETVSSPDAPDSSQSLSG